MNRFACYTDANGLMSAVTPSDYIDTRVLAANTAETFTRPAKARFVRLTGTAQFFYSITGAAAVPSTDVIGGNGVAVVCANIQETLYIENVTSISVVAPGAATVSAEWFA